MNCQLLLYSLMLLTHSFMKCKMSTDCELDAGCRMVGNHGPLSPQLYSQVAKPMGFQYAVIRDIIGVEQSLI